jgi:mRNA interferase MazF
VKAPLRGEVYMVDLGLAAKVRPCVVVSVPLEASDRSLVTVVPHTIHCVNLDLRSPPRRQDS